MGKKSGNGWEKERNRQGGAEQSFKLFGRGAGKRALIPPAIMLAAFLRGFR